MTANGTLPAVGARGACSSGVFAVSWAAGIRTRTKPDLSALILFLHLAASQMSGCWLDCGGISD